MPKTLDQLLEETKGPPSLDELLKNTETHAPTIPDPQGLPSEGLKPFVAPLSKPKTTKRPRWEEFVDAAARGIARTGSAGAQAIKKFWEYEPPQMPSWPYVPKTKAMKKTETEQAGKWDKRAKFLWEVSKNPGLAAQNEDLASKALNLIGETIPYISATTAAYTATGPMGGFAVGSLVEGNSAYRTALDSGVPEDKAKNIGVAVGMVSGAIEAFGGRFAEDLALKAASKIKSKILKGGAVFGIGTVVEALEEGGQQIAELTGETTYRDVNWKEAVNRTLGSMAGGAFLGGTMRGTSMAGRGMFAPEPAYEVGEDVRKAEAMRRQEKALLPDVKEDEFVIPKPPAAKGEVSIFDSSEAENMRQKAQKMADKKDRRIGMYYGKDKKFHLFSTLNPPKGITHYESITPEIPTPAPAKPLKQMAEKPKIKKIGKPGFVDLTPIAQAGQQVKTAGEKAAKHITRFGGVEKNVQKTLIEYEEQLRELPKVAAKDAIAKFGRLTEAEERTIENFREQPTKYPLPENLKAKYRELEQGIKDYGKRLEKLGYPADWPNTYVKRLEKRLEKLKKREAPDPIQEKQLEQSIEEAKDLRYLHHQYQPTPLTKRARQWFRRRITKKPRGVLGRKIPTYEKAEELGLKRAPLAVSYAHMAHEVMRAETANELIKAINNNPNLSQWSEDAPEGWVYLDSNIFPESVQHLTWAEEGKVGHKIRRRKYPVPIAEALEELTYARSNNAMARWYDKTNFALKLVGFYNPLVMTKNDLVQMWRAAGTLRTLNPVVWGKAINTFAKKDAEYNKLRKAGLFNNVVNYTPAVKELTQQMLDKIRLSSGERAAKIAADWLNPAHIIKDIRRFNEATTWNIDEVIRIACYKAAQNTKKLDGLTEFEKIEWVNDAMVNYAKLPKATKKQLSRWFFVPTYRIGNFRYFWSQVAKHPWRYKGPLLRTVGYKMFVQFGLPAIVASAIAWKLKDKKDVWTEKGYRVVIHNPETGKDTVYALSDPLLEGAKVTQRTLRHTFKVNLAALPHLAHRVLTGPQYKSRDPSGEFLKIGTPFYRDIVNWTDPDKSTHQKILTQLAIAYVYSRKHKAKDKETAVNAYAKALSLWTNWKEQKEDVERMLGRKFYSLMPTKDIVKSIRENTYKKAYRREGKLYRKGAAHKGQEENVKRLREELARRRSK